MMTVFESTVSHGYCIGCGACAASCPVGAIRMEYTDNKVYEPTVNRDICIQCRRCVSVCPNSVEERTGLIEMLKKRQDPCDYGVDNGVGFFYCKSLNADQLMKSPSGGAVTAMALSMLEKGIINKVVCAERVLAKTGEPHFRACVVDSASELEKRRGSIYGPICFDEVFQAFQNTAYKVLFIGTPCVVRAAKKLFSQIKAYRGNTLYTIALTCSHNVSGQFVDYFAEYAQIPEEEAYMVNFREKIPEMKDHGSYYIHLYAQDKDYLLEERNEYFTPIWREYCFAQEACMECPDFWGSEADMSCKDAWGKWGAGDQYGSSIVVIRRKEFLPIFTQLRSMTIKKLSYEDAQNCQIETVRYKQQKVISRFGNPDARSADSHYQVLRKTRELYAGENGFERVNDQVVNELVSNFHVAQTQSGTTMKAKIKRIIKKCLPMRMIHAVEPIWRPVFVTLRQILRYRKKKYNKVVMLGTFNQVNAGDEAQIDATIQIMQDRYPNHLIQVLSHVPLYTWKNHYRCTVAPNPRLAIWDLDMNPGWYSDMDKPLNKWLFLLKGYWCCINAYLVRANLPTFFLSAKRAALLENLKTSDLIYFSGGGGMTGATLSRCWDFVFCMKLAGIFKVPFVMSGQNSGLWGSKFTERFVSKHMRNAKAVTLRDPEAVDNLRAIGVEGDHIFTMFDDALFCDKLENVDDYLQECGLTGKPYVAMNLHYWGIENDPQAQQHLIQRLKIISDYIIEKTGMDILLIPMASVDAVPMEDFVNYARNERIHLIRFPEYDFRVIRGLFAKARFCATMKHHPIIFAVGEGVPTISIAYKPYYVYKNAGALKIFGLEKYNIDVENDSYLHEFKTLFDEIVGSELEIKDAIQNQLTMLAERREKLFRIVDDILR